MNNESVKKPSLFDYFLNDINEESLSDHPYDKKLIPETSKSNERNPTFNQDPNLNESNNDCDVMLKAFDDAFETIYGDNEINILQVQQTSEELQTNCIHLINMVKSYTIPNKTEQLRSKYTLPENESLDTINKLQNQISELNMQLKQQSIFSSNIGSSFGYHLWKATQIPNVVNNILQQDKITDMAKLFTSILSSFVETYASQMPSIKTSETKFVLSILGIVANLTTSKAGRHYFTQANDGINVINCIVSLVLCVPSTLKHNLKKTAYAALYNVSIKFNRHLFINNDKLIKTLHDDIKVTTNKDIDDTILFPLKLLHSLTRNINEPIYIILKNEINLQEILKLTRFTKTELLARKIYENFNIADDKYKV